MLHPLIAWISQWKIPPTTRNNSLTVLIHRPSSLDKCVVFFWNASSRESTSYFCFALTYIFLWSVWAGVPAASSTRGLSWYILYRYILVHNLQPLFTHEWIWFVIWFVYDVYALRPWSATWARTGLTCIPHWFSDRLYTWLICCCSPYLFKKRKIQDAKAADPSFCSDTGVT